MNKSDDENLRPATKLVQGGRRPEWTGDPRLGGSIVNPPVWRASTILYDTIADLEARGHATHDKLYYGRRGTPTVWALADALTDMEPGAVGTLLYPSGVAANSAGLLALLAPGDHLLMVDSAYEPTRAFCDSMLARYGVATTYYDPLVGASIADLITPQTKLIFLESPGSLTFEVQDIPAITRVARDRGVLTMLDNTWATPLLFPALAHGVDVTMMSLTKYVGGHSDAMMGSLTATKAVWPRLRSAAYPGRRWVLLALEVARWLTRGDGVLTWSPGMVGVFARTQPGLEAPDIQLNGGPVSWAEGRMGSEGTGAPLDPLLRLRGVQGLRVVDASVFPDIPVCNINATVLAVAHRAAGLIGQAAGG